MQPPTIPLLLSCGNIRVPSSGERGIFASFSHLEMESFSHQFFSHSVLDAVECIPELILLIRDDQFLLSRSTDFCLHPDQTWISHRLRIFYSTALTLYYIIGLSSCFSQCLPGALDLEIPSGVWKLQKLAPRTTVACGGAWYRRAFSPV